MLAVVEVVRDAEATEAVGAEGVDDVASVTLVVKEGAAAGVAEDVGGSEAVTGQWPWMRTPSSPRQVGGGGHPWKPNSPPHG